MAVRKLEQELEAMGAFREAPPEDARVALRHALKDPVNVIVAKAASIAAARAFDDLTPDLLRAFDRIFTRDPKCWGKLAIIEALTAFEHRNSAPFLRGLRHAQMEPVWGGQADTAETLRAACAVGLVATNDLDRTDMLRALIDRAADPSDAVRIAIVRGIAQMQGEEAPLLLRMKAQLGDASEAVMGQTFDALLWLEGERALPFIAEFLRRGAMEAREEAALSLGSSRLPGAIPLLRAACEDSHLREQRESLVRALALSRDPAAIEYLLDWIRDGRESDAVVAADALALAPDREAMRRQAEEAASDRSAELRAAIARAFSEVVTRAR